MESEVLLTKMESLSRCISRIESKKPESQEDLDNDLDLQDIIVINLERAVQQCIDAGLHILADYNSKSVNTSSDVFSALAENRIIEQKLAEDLIKAVGFRNIAIHEYRSIDWNIVWSIISNNIQNFRDYQKAVLHLI